MNTDKFAQHLASSQVSTLPQALQRASNIYKTSKTWRIHINMKPHTSNIVCDTGRRSLMSRTESLQLHCLFSKLSSSLSSPSAAAALSTSSSSSSSTTTTTSSTSSASSFSSSWYSSRLWSLLYLLLLVLVVVESAPSVVESSAPSTVIEEDSRSDLRTVDDFLSKFGYYGHTKQDQQPGANPVFVDMDTGVDVGEHGVVDDTVLENTEQHTETERHHAIERLQSFFHLPATGQLDTDTKNIIKTARCGVKDVNDDEDEDVEKRGEDNSDEGLDAGGRTRKKRYSIRYNRDGSVARWEVGELTWRITRPTRQISESLQRSVLSKAFAKWAEYVPIRFREVGGQEEPDINIQFARGEHGPNDVFDGSPKDKPNVLAHAWHPGLNPKSIAGDVHFDDDDDWTNTNFLLVVAVHELGHTMGLDHSKDTTSVMYAAYQDTPDFSQDDLNGINALYGDFDVGRRPVTTTRSPRYNTPRPDSRYGTDRPDPRYRTDRPDPRYRTERPDPRYRTERPDPRYRTDRPDPRYRTDRPDPRYRTERPDPRYRTDRPDPRYRTERPDPRYRTYRPDPRYRTYGPDPRDRTDIPDFRTRAPYYTVSPEWIPEPTTAVDQCTSIQLDAFFEDPTTVLGRVYVAISGDRVHKLSSQGRLIQSQSLDTVYPEVPANPDVAFSIPYKRTVYFIKDNTMWAYKGNQLVEGYPRSLHGQRFPEPPKFAVTLTDRPGNSRLLLFGANYWWTFDVDRPTTVRPEEMSAFSADLPRDVTFAATWADNQLYAVTEDSYVIIDLQRRQITHDKPIAGKPEWLHALCDNGSRASASVSLTTLIILTSLTTLVKSVLL